MTIVKLFKNGKEEIITETPLNRNLIISDLKNKFDKVLVDKYYDFEKCTKLLLRNEKGTFLFKVY